MINTYRKTVQMSGNNKTVSETALLNEWEEIQAAQKDASLFRPLYDRYYNRIFRFIYKRSADENTSSDICAQVFLKAMQRLKDYQYKGVPFSAWLFRIASNEVTQHFRDKQKSRIVSIEDYSFADLADEIKIQDDEMLRTTLIQSLEYLKENDLTLIELRFFEQRPFKEIADILNITENNAKVKTYRILERLKKIILKRIK